MERRERGLLENIDWATILTYLALVLIGWISIYSAVYDEAHKSIFDLDARYGKQLVWIGISLLIALFILVIDPKFFSQTSYLWYGVFIVMLLAVLAVGSETKGAKSWFGVGDFGIQPSEFAKATTALALAKILSGIDVDMKNLKTKFAAITIVAIPMLLVLLQNDTGSALVFLVFVLVLFREGLSLSVLIFGAAMAILFVLSLVLNPYLLISILFIIAIVIWWLNRKRKLSIWLCLGLFVFAAGVVLSVEYVYDNALESHQKDRIEVLLGQKSDPKGVEYNVNQSKIAIGSGGLFGKGFLKGTQTKYNFVPEQDTDFIFCTIGEEWGFVGSVFVIGLYLSLMIKLIKMAERQRSKFSRVYGYCVTSILFAHFTVNIGMTIGLLPVIGIPLPFISYGGSSLMAFTLLLFIFIRQDASRMDLV
ncbi:MAG: rod shape-determining protein RodA [Bacteroidales bacterium]|jgi:rod shape determining protein RodA|nr:rod shape-determining protein RodA [Bacteroidales bacterium]MDD2576649.1 rod shape-determining protein RodA [Bacteroidales bacterium]MDD3668095.1 rod shape-determining protein RodA [Bacteroidales bacterium]MDD4739438.1 rod shape-determining protein RodA [Bacteroidales bacterium]